MHCLNGKSWKKKKARSGGEKSDRQLNRDQWLRRSTVTGHPLQRQGGWRAPAWSRVAATTDRGDADG